MKKNSSEDIYNVNKYTDIELFQILDLINPSDRELEAKIIQMMNKYRIINNEAGSQLYRFFNNIYNHFFESSDEEIEGMDERKIVYSGPKSAPNSATNPIINNGQSSISYGNNLLFGNAVVSGNTIVSGNAVTGNAVVGKTIDVNTDYRKSDVSLTKPLDYSKDTLNPLLKQTVKRVITIDSSYRPNNKDISTEFTFNLSEPLRDVLSLKLYSVQIPYSWYTISNQYGSNFFYLKGNSDGINNGEHDYEIKINAGNYTQALLIDAINASISEIAAKNTDVSFGDTGINYNTSTQLATFTIDITKLHNESNYYLYFPNWTSPTNNTLRYNSIPGFFGFNYTSYVPSVIYSLRNLPGTDNNDNNQSIYAINSSNNYFTIKQYTGYSEYSNTSQVIWSHDISFNPNNIKDSNYSRQTLYNNLNTQLQNSPYLINSYIERLNILTNSSLDGAGFSFYKLFIQLNPKTTPNIKNSKTIVIFPNETGDTKIWTGSGSCFSFEFKNNELNNVVSETQTLQTNYIISSNPYIYLRCINTKYNKNNDASYIINDYQIDISNSDATGYTLTQYIDAINNSFVSKNQTTTSTKYPKGDFNMPNGSDYVNSNTNVSINNDSKIQFRFDINKIFDETKYRINFSGTDLSNVLHITGNNIDLSNQNVFTGNFNITGSGYRIDSPYLMVISPKSGYGNEYAGNFSIPPLYSNKNYDNLIDMETDINYAFSRFTDNDGDNVLSGTNIKFTNNSGIVTATLTIKINKILTQTDYKISFYDYKSTNGWSADASNSWYNFLKIPQQSYNLNDKLVEGQSYAQIDGSYAIYGNQITLIDNSNNYFYIKPLPNAKGLYTTNATNDIKITINPGSYTRPQLLQAINTKLSENPITNGSSITIISKNNAEYTKIRFNVNKIFTANDYRLVFYDPYSFVKCYVGSKSVKNTTWDSTIGWVLGFRSLTEYNLIKANEEVDPNDETKIYYIGTQSYYSSNSSVVSITGDTAVSVSLYNYFYILLDDYTQSHLNDGLVTITSTESDIALPSYATRNVVTCDPIDQSQLIQLTGNSTQSENVNYLTQREIYATNAKIASRKNKVKSYSSGPFVKDIFGLIPIKTAGLQNGSVYTEFGGTLQNQDRTYFGPVNIQRMSVKLMNERGDVVDLNNTNWSFSLICEQLYQQRTL
jgi:hypothetical protein